MSTSADEVKPLVWVVTGASSGIGKAIALEAVQTPGAIVYAIGRDQEALRPLAKAGCLVVRLDVTDEASKIEATIAEIVKDSGKVDILVNAAGYLLEGGVEETSEGEALEVFQTNLFGPLRLIRAVLPFMRQQRAGTILNICGIATYRGSPNAGLYCATKAALSTLTESLQHETEPLGIRVCLVQLGHFRTPFLTPGHRRRVSSPIEDYNEVLDPLRKAFNGLNGAQPGDSARAAQVLVELASLQDGVAGIPMFLPLGSDVIPAIRATNEARVEAASSWEHLTSATDVC
ncbi:hypothetical protein F5Y14DRAFT_315188 [Nemania sp. NC0429]|nr:hypothetical protein F5Y14DRAFT_315188 [Nemania sp. NC0429]